MFSTIIAFLGGILAASGAIIKKRPDAAEFIDKIAPFQGIIGVVILFWGISGLISSLTGLGLLSSHPVYWIIGFVTALATFIVGFLLAFSLLSKYLFSKNETAMEKGVALRSKLINWQVPSGFLLIIMAVLSMLVWLRIL